MELKGTSTFKPSITKGQQKPSGTKTEISGKEIQKKSSTSKSSGSSTSKETKEQPSSTPKDTVSRELNKEQSGFKLSMKSERSSSTAFSGKTGRAGTGTMTKDSAPQVTQNKMQSLSEMSRKADEAKLPSNPVASSDIMKHLTGIAMPLLGETRPKEGDKKVKKDGAETEKTSSGGKDGEGPSSASLKDGKGVEGKKFFSKMDDAKRLIKKEFAGDTSVLGGKSMLKSDMNKFAQLRTEALFNPSGPPSQEQLRQAIRHAATAIWDILKKAKDEDGDDDLTAGLLGMLMKLHSSFTFEHSNRVMDLTMSLASELGIDDQQQLENLKRAAFFKDIGQYGPDDLSSFPGQEDGEVVKYIKEIKNSLRECSNLHDIGKMRIPSSILNKNGPLDDEEFAQIKLHPIIGVEIVLPFPALHGSIPGIRWHHEKWNGKGYPDGKKGKDIPLQARIISVCDTFDAMTEDRPYRKALSSDQAIKELIRCAGSQFDPVLVPAFIHALAKKGEINISAYEEDIKKIQETYSLENIEIPIFNIKDK